MGPIIGKPGLIYEYNTSSIDIDGDNIYYLWDWDDGTEFVWFGPYSSGETCVGPHTWTNEGVYNVKVKAKDQLNLESEWSEPLEVTIILQSPVADADGPYYSSTDDKIHFDSSGSYDPDGTIVSYQWDFGDGNTGTGIKPYHQYYMVGDYTVSLTVTDDDGLTDTDTTYARIGYGDPPLVQLIYPRGGETLSGKVNMRWSAIDSEMGQELPIKLFYSDNDGENWVQINGVLCNNINLTLGEYEWDTTTLPDGEYKILVEAQDDDNNVGHDNSNLFTIKNYEEPPENHPPNKPTKADGPVNGKAGVEYSYLTTAFDEDDDEMWFKWDWGDGIFSEWLGPYTSRSLVEAVYTWNADGIYDIKVKAKDQYGDESSWSDPLSITMSKKKSLDFDQLILIWLIEKFSFLQTYISNFYDT
jgi:hypothetical protein